MAEFESDLYDLMFMSPPITNAYEDKIPLECDERKDDPNVEIFQFDDEIESGPVFVSGYAVSDFPLIGKGSFGKVVRASDILNPNNTVAVKTITSKLGRQSSHYCLYIYRELFLLR